MSKKEKKVKTKVEAEEKAPIEKSSKGAMHSDVKKNITAILFVVFSLLFLLSLFGQAGVVGNYINRSLGLVLGWSKFLLPVLLLVLGVVYFRQYDRYRYYLTTAGAILFLVFLATIMHSFYDLSEMKEWAKVGKGGGYLGFGMAYVLIKYLGVLAASILVFC